MALKKLLFANSVEQVDDSVLENRKLNLGTTGRPDWRRVVKYSKTSSDDDVVLDSPPSGASGLPPGTTAIIPATGAEFYVDDNGDWQLLSSAGGIVTSVSVDYVGSTLTVNVDGVSDTTTIVGGTNTYVTSGVIVGNTLTLTLSDASTVAIDVSSLLDNNEVTSAAIVGSNLVLTKSDASTVTTDVSTLIDNVQVASGAIVGTDLILTMSDASSNN